jgi:hypothetical protein
VHLSVWRLGSELYAAVKADVEASAEQAKAATPLTMAAETVVAVCMLITLDSFQVRGPNAGTEAIIANGLFRSPVMRSPSVTFLTAAELRYATLS